jgi:hypothetical protein
MQSNLWKLFIVCLYLYWRFNYQRRRVGIPLTGLISPHFCACPKPGPGFPIPYFVVLFVFYDLRWEVVATFLCLCQARIRISKTICSMIWGERWLFVLFILVELLTITVSTFFSQHLVSLLILCLLFESSYSYYLYFSSDMGTLCS